MYIHQYGQLDIGDYRTIPQQNIFALSATTFLNIFGTLFEVEILRCRKRTI